MATIKYDKLIRDRIPEIIEAAGKKASIRVANQQEAVDYLIKKCKEEIQEFDSSRSPEELADISEVFDALCEAAGVTKQQLSDLKKKKNEKNGSFKKRLVLLEVEE